MWVDVPEGFEEDAWDEKLPARDAGPFFPNKTAENGLTMMSNGVVSSRAPMRHIEVFGAQGRLIRSIHLKSPAREAFIGGLGVGAFFLRISTVSGGVQVFRRIGKP